MFRIPSNPSAYYPFHQDNKNDYSGRGNHATIAGTVTALKGVRNRGAVKVVGVSNIVRPPVGPSFNAGLYSGKGTIVIWFYRLGSATGSGNYHNLTLSDDGANYNQFYILNSDNQLQFYQGSNLASGYIVPVNVWNMYTVTSDGSTVKIYVNDKLQSTHASKAMGNTSGTGTNGCEIGSHSTFGGTNGMIGDTLIYQRGFSHEEVRQTYNSMMADYKSSPFGTVPIVTNTTDFFRFF